MNDNEEKRVLIEQIKSGIEGLLLSDRVSDDEKNSVAKEMLSIIEFAKKECVTK